MDEDDDRAFAVTREEIDDLARAGTIRDHARGMLLAIGGRILRPTRDQRGVLRDSRPVVVFDLVVNGGHVEIQAPFCADFCAEAFVFAKSRINSRTSFGERSENMSAIQVSCSAAILRNSARPALVSRMTWTRRSASDVRRSRWPDSTRRSTRPVRS